MSEHTTEDGKNFQPSVQIDPALEERCKEIINPYMRRADHASVRRLAKELLLAAEGSDGYEGRARGYLLEADIKEGRLDALDERFMEILPKLEHTFAATLCRTYRLWADARLQLGDIEGARTTMQKAVDFEPAIDRRDRSLRARLENHYELGLIEWMALEPGLARAHYEMALPCITDDTDRWNRGQLKVLGALVHFATDPVEAQRLFDEAIGYFTAPDDPLVYDQARALDAWGRATNQSDLVKRAVALYDSIGSRRLAGLARRWIASLEPRVAPRRNLIKATPEEIAALLPPGTIVGGDETYRLLANLHYLASNKARTFLLRGPSGVGKEVFARAIARFSVNAPGPFEALDCGALTPTLAESELFGHRKGAFTGATDNRKGIFERANGGTVFLDEIQNLPLDLQPKLLRVLQEREFLSLGAERATTFDVILIVGTNADLEAMVKAGSFREDLYWRIYEHPITIPALANRREEIATFAKHFVAREAAERGFTECALSAGALTALEGHAWPGNLRQLGSVARQLVSLAGDTPITQADVACSLETGTRGGPPPDSPLAQHLEDARQLGRLWDNFINAGRPVDLEGGLLGFWRALWRAIIGITYHRELESGEHGARARMGRRLGIEGSQASYHLDAYRANRKIGLPRDRDDDECVDDTPANVM